MIIKYPFLVIIKYFVQDPIDAHYEMLKTDISVVEESSDEYKVIIGYLDFCIILYHIFAELPR